MEATINLASALLEFISEPAFLVIGTQKPEVRVNKELLKLLGFHSEKNLLDMVLGSESILSGKDMSRLKSDTKKTRAGQEVKGKEYVITTSCGEEIHATIHLRLLHEVKSVWILGYLEMAGFDTVRCGSPVDMAIHGLLQEAGILDEVIAIIDFQGNVISANRKFFVIDFYADLSDQKVNLFKIIDKSEHKKLRTRLAQLEKGLNIPPTQYKLIQRHHKHAYIEIFSRPARVNRKNVIVSVIRDITNRKELEKKVMEMIVHTEDRERKRFARDLHDEIGPYLSGLKLYLNELENLEDEPEKRKKILPYMVEVVNEAIKRTREISNNMLPAQIVQFGLMGSLQNFIDKLNKVRHIDIVLRCTGPEPDLEPTYSFSIYQIVIELITNSIRHSGATKIEIDCAFQQEELSLKYVDNGKGFQLDEHLKSTKGIGLHSIISRTNMYGGTYTFNSEANQGIAFDFRFSVT